MDVLRPSEQLPYFDVNETTPTLQANVASQIVPADAERVALIIAPASNGGTVSVATKRENTTNGWFLTNTVYLNLTQGQHGPLPAQQWFGNIQAGGRVYVMEVFLRRFPRPNLEGLTP